MIRPKPETGPLVPSLLLSTLVKFRVDRLMLGLLFGGEAVKAILPPINRMMEISAAPNKLQQIDAELDQSAQQMRALGEQYLGVK